MICCETYLEPFVAMIGVQELFECYLAITCTPQMLCRRQTHPQAMQSVLTIGVCSFDHLIYLSRVRAHWNQRSEQLAHTNAP